MTNQQKKNVRKWIEALRSGEYQQVRGTLFGKTDDGCKGYCCLGVARCEFKNTPYRVYEGKEWSDFEGLLTGSSFEKTFGLNSSVQHTLANMNDNGNSFDSIADHLESLIA